MQLTPRLSFDVLCPSVISAVTPTQVRLAAVLGAERVVQEIQTTAAL